MFLVRERSMNGWMLSLLRCVVTFPSIAPRQVDAQAASCIDRGEGSERIVRKIVAALEMTLTPREAHEVGERLIDNVVAYDCYLRARQQMYAWVPGSLDSTSRLVDQALEIVGDGALLLPTQGQIQ
jgi:hypothetical protein